MSDPSGPFEDQVVFLYTAHLDATVAFYAETVGLEMVRDQGACRIFRTGPHSFLGVCDLPERPQSPTGVTVTLVTDDVDGWYERLLAKGVVFEQSPRHSERFGVYACLLHDPNGYRIEIQRFNHPLA